MVDFKENTEDELSLSGMGMSMDTARNKIIREFEATSPRIYQIFQRWEDLASNLNHDQIRFPQAERFGNILCKMRRDTLGDGNERSIIGLEIVNDFFLTDVTVGNSLSVRNSQLIVNGIVRMRNAPQLYDLYEQPKIKLDDGKFAKVTYQIHTHPKDSTNFYNQSELPNFENSRFATEGGVFGVIATYGAYMSKAGSSPDTTRLYTLNKHGNFIFSEENSSQDLVIDYFDDYLRYDEREILFTKAYK